MQLSMRLNRSFLYIGLLVSIGTYSCGPAVGNDPGHEYMPDMFHSIAYEANYYDYYSLNTWGDEGDYHAIAQPRTQIPGTIPFGEYSEVSHAQGNAALYATAFQNIPRNGQVPYHYANTEDDRIKATSDLVQNPFPITTEGLERGKELYTIYCGICHGDKGDGNGYLVREDGGVYPAQPAILTNDEFTTASVGRLYHAIMYGKNVMGGYGDKLSYEERWDVIHYIRFLQAKERDLVYSEESNLLNSETIVVLDTLDKLHDALNNGE